MSCIDTVGRSARLRTRAQKWAISIESAPRSSKKWLSTGYVLDAHEVGQYVGEAPLAFGEGGQITSQVSGQDVGE